MPFQPGNKANPGGRPKEKAFADAVRVAVNRQAEDGRKKLMLLADRLIDFALAGEGWAMQQIADRLDGKPAQESTVTVHRVTRELSDDELSDIALGSGEGVDPAPVDPAKLN